MAELQGIRGIPAEPQLRKPETYHERLQGFKSKIFKDSVMEPGFIESLTAPEGSPIDYQNISSVAGGRTREMFVDPMRRFGGSIEKGMTGKPLTIGDQLNLIEGMIDTTVGGLFQHGVQKGGFDPNTLHMFVGPKAKDIVKAEGMVARGSSPAEIQSKLLMHKKPDGMWRKEISDVDMVAKDYLRTPNEVYQGLERDILTGRGEGMEDTLKNLEKYRDLSQSGIKELIGKRQQGIKESIDREDFDGVREVMKEYRGVQSMDIGMRDRTRGALNDYVKHPELFSQYPGLERMSMQRKYEIEGGYGGLYRHGNSFNSPSMEIKAGASRAEELPIYGHEIQHGIQGSEGWARGGSPEEMGLKLASLKKDMDFHTSVSALAREAKATTGGNLDKAMDELNELGLDITQEHIDQVMRIGEKEAIRRGEESQKKLTEFVGGNGKKPFALYMNLLGEREARDTASRLGLDLEQRRGLVPDLGEGAQVLMR